MTLTRSTPLARFLADGGGATSDVVGRYSGVAATAGPADGTETAATIKVDATTPDVIPRRFMVHPRRKQQCTGVLLLRMRHSWAGRILVGLESPSTPWGPTSAARGHAARITLFEAEKSESLTG